MKGNFHTGGEGEHRMLSAARRGYLLDRLEGRFHALAGVLCRRKGPLRDLRILLGWMRIRRRFGRLHPREEKSRALWLGA